MEGSVSLIPVQGRPKTHKAPQCKAEDRRRVIKLLGGVPFNVCNTVPRATKRIDQSILVREELPKIKAKIEKIEAELVFIGKLLKNRNLSRKRRKEVKERKKYLKAQLKNLQENLQEKLKAQFYYTKAYYMLESTYEKAREKLKELRRKNPGVDGYGVHEWMTGMLGPEFLAAYFYAPDHVIELVVEHVPQNILDKLETLEVDGRKLNYREKVQYLTYLVVRFLALLRTESKFDPRAQWKGTTSVRATKLMPEALGSLLVQLLST